MRDLNWGQVTAGVLVGLILGVGATLYLQNERLARLEERVAIAGAGPLPSNNPPSNPTPAGTASEPSRQLSEFIQEEQRRNVKESFGELAHQAFTDVDLEKFQDEDRAQKIAEALRSNKDYLATVLALKRATPPERERVLADSVAPLHPTFAELGGPTTDGRGQTVAGQRAEELIAEAIVEMTRTLLKKSEDELVSLYEQ